MSTTQQPTVDLVIASYGEDLSWMKWIPENWRVFLYNAKEGRENFPVGATPIRVPNGGREAGQYLQHLVQNYGDHSDYTLFVQGMPFDHEPTALIKKFLGEPFGPHPMQYIGALPPVKGGLFIPCHGDVEKALRKAYGEEQISPPIIFSVGAQFYIKREVILDRPKEFYEKLLENAYDPQWFSFGHMMEANWGCVFDWPKFA
jgi:hypothetical protein